MIPAVEIEMFELSFVAESSKSITFSCSFSHFPKVTAITDGNENIYVSDITKNSCLIHSSINMTGTVRVQVMGYA